MKGPGSDPSLGIEASEAVDYISSVSQTDVVSVVDLGTQTSSFS
jgi:hypothetical protein